MWRPIETAPVDGRSVKVREAGGAWGYARVIGTRDDFPDPRHRHIWAWVQRRGKAYPVEWQPEEPPDPATGFPGGQTALGAG